MTPEQFWSRVDLNGPIPAHCAELGPCWSWTGDKSHGYGVLESDRITKPERANRYALEMRLCRALAHGMLACHRCDNPSCVNPAHLFEGTQSDNMRDAARKGRIAAGARTTKLTPSQVRAIRAMDGPSRIAAERYGVSASVIARIRRRVLWRNVA